MSDVPLQFLKRQAGLTLVEAMVSLTISLIVVSAMVSLMGNSLGTTTRIIGMSNLSNELRNAMSMMTRDVRRANYNARSLYCYGNADCADDGIGIAQAGDVSVNDSNDCFTFELDRDWDGDSTEDAPGGFRLVTAAGIGRIEMWVGDASPDCAASSDDWMAVTDPNAFDITTFSVSDDDSYTGTATVKGSSYSQRVREIKLVIEGELISDTSITRRIEDSIKIRNDLLL